MSLFVYPFSPVLDAGEVSPGALAKFYISGTSTPADGQSGNPAVYTSATLATAHDWPVEADSDGHFSNIYLDPAVRYKVVITDADGTELFTADPIPDDRFVMLVETISSATHTMAANDHGATLYRTYSGDMSDTLPTAASVGNGWWVNIVNGNTTPGNVVTVSVTGGGAINGNSSFDIPGLGRATFVSTGTAYLAWTMGDNPVLTQGFRSQGLSAAYLSPTTTNGVSGSLQQAETSSNKVNYFYWPFPDDATKNLFHHIDLPASYTGDVMPQVSFVWTAAAGSPGDTVRWAIKARVVNNDVAIDGSWGTAATVDDALLATGDIHVSAWVEFTPSGSGNDCPLFFQVYRDHTAGTLAEDARLIEVRLRIPFNRGNDS